MTDIRPITRADGDSFLRVLCEVFDLDFDRATSIFYREPLFDLRRKWACFESGRIVSVLTTVPLHFGWGDSIGVAGVGTLPAERGKGYASALMREVLSYSETAGEGPALLFAKNPELYEGVGFQKLDTVVRAPLPPTANTPQILLSQEEVQLAYEAWALSDDSRLRRDGARWDYWKWNLRMCFGVADGYVCYEGGLVREAVSNATVTSWPLDLGSEWLGLKNMLPTGCEGGVREMDLLGRGFPALPQMFMTDQF